MCIRRVYFNSRGRDREMGRDNVSNDEDIEGQGCLGAKARRDN